MIKKVIIILLFVSPAFSQQIVGRKPLLGEQVNWSHQLTKGLMGLWLFNEGSGPRVYDLSMNGNEGTLTGMVPLDDWIPGRNGYALDFDGDGDFISLTGSNSFYSPGTGGYAVSGWFKTSSGTFQTIYSNGTGATHLVQLIVHDTGAMGVAFRDGGGNTLSISSGSFADGEWHFAVGNRISTTSAEIWVDGLLVTSGTEAALGSIDLSTSTHVMGRFHTGTQQFSGSLDDIRVYNRTLMPQEIWSLYVNPYAMFDKPLIGRILAAAVAAAAVERGRLIITND